MPFMHLAYPTYQSVEINPAFGAFFDSEDALVNFCNAAISLPNELKIVSLTYEKCGRDKMLQGTPIEFFFSINAMLSDQSKLRIAVHKKSIYSSIDHQILGNKSFRHFSPYKITCEPGELFSAHSEHYDYVIWLAFTTEKYRTDRTDKEFEQISKSWGQTYRKTTSTCYICYEIPLFTKELEYLETDEDRWIFLLRTTPQANKAFFLGIPVFDSALKRIMSSEVSLKLAMQQDAESDIQMEFLYQMKNARDRGRADSCYKTALVALGLPESTSKEDLPSQKRQVIALFMLDEGVDPFYTAIYTDLPQNEVEKLQKILETDRAKDDEPTGA